MEGTPPTERPERKKRVTFSFNWKALAIGIVYKPGELWIAPLPMIGIRIVLGSGK